jgi:hypothetical protein
MATLDQLRLEQLLQPFNNQTGIVNTNQALPMINNNPFINTGAIDQRLQNTDLIQQLIEQNQQKLNLANTADTVPFFFPQINNQIPQINNQVPLNFDTSYGVANEEDVEQVDYLPGQSSFKDKISNIGSSFMEKTGIGGLLGLITGNPILGLIGRGIGALANRAGPGLNDFRNASTGAQFFQNLRDRRAREDAAERGLAKQQEIARQTAIQAMTTNQAYGGSGGGGIGSSVGGGASPGSAGPGGSDEMGSF